uniref:Uncharacterized protein n=1 Tax=Knipowitschia caucasica TaxID=637954 RepID=A0AAV2MNF0_KNICA
MQSVKQCLEERLEKEINESDRQREKMEMLELQDFEELKVKYSLSVEQNQSLEGEFKEHMEDLKMLNQCLEEQVSVRRSLEKQISERVSYKTRIETLEHQLQDFEELKVKYSLSVEQNQSLERELEKANEISRKHETEHKEACEKLIELQLSQKKVFKEDFGEIRSLKQVSVGKGSEQQNNESANQCKKIEMLERQLQEFEEVKEEYTWAVELIQRLEKELEESREVSRKHEAEHKQACEKLVELQLLQKKVFKDHLGELPVFKEMFKEQVEGKRVEQQISEVVPLEKPSMSETQTQSVASVEMLTDVQDVREENSASKENVKNRTQFYEGQLEQNKQQQGSELKRNRVKGKNVEALMKRFDQ